MATPKLPPHIQKQIDAMAKQKPAAAKAPAPLSASAPASSSGGGALRALAAAGWLLAVLAGAVAFGEYQWAASQRQAALDRQAADYEQKIQQMKAAADAIKAEADARVKKTQDDALANQASIQAELDFQRLPELPLDTVFRPGPVLYVESKAADVFKCTVRLTRPVGNQTREMEFEIKPRTYRDLGAIGDWVFARGDKVEFVKSGFKPRQLEAP